MKVYSKLAAALLAAAGVGAGSTALAAEQIGVSKNEIVVGTIQDLSGPLAGFGKALRYGLQMRADEVNAAGGINGRKIKFVAEDSGYDPKKGLLAAQKMVQQDKIFAMVGTVGTAVNLATFPTLFDKGVMNLFPLTAAREMYEPLHKLKFSFAAPYYDQMRMAMKWMVKERGAKKFCVIYQDDDFGTEVLKGGEDGLKDINMSFAEKTSFKRGATDFSAQVSKMKAADCDTVVLGTIIRETIGTIGTARKMGWNPHFIGSSAAYTDLIHKLGGKAMDGLYAMHQVAVPYADDSSKNVREWYAAYKAKFNEDPGLFSAYGYVAMDMFVQVAKKTGPNLTTDNFLKVLESTTFSRDMFGSPEYKFTPKQHLGNDKSKVGQIQNGRWVAITDYLSH
ncbi:MAG: ABC transporter substrate-binding protein [Sulfuritalea sp.]|jgi:branched-chain amino acid transport system substrate-binding protein|nr:ABC transporter substrate-binding protein [Sulfuritalea sp.]